jgi:CRISPR-associated protein Cas5t
MCHMCVLQAHCNGLPVAAVERYQLLQTAVAMLPGGVQSAHAEELLQRHHIEHLEPQVLQQASSEAAPWLLDAPFVTCCS